MGLPELIPQSKLFGNPDKAEPKISPDGKRYAYLASSDKGVLNVFVQEVGSETAKQVTNDTHRGVRMYEWAKNNRHLLYMQDKDGDENFHIYAVDLDAGVVRDMTPFEGIRAQNLFLNKRFPDRFLVGLNVRDRSVFDMHSVDLATGAIVEDTRNPGDVSSWVVDADMAIRGAVAMVQEDGSKVLRVRDAPGVEWREVGVWPQEETGNFHRFTQDGKGIYAESSKAHGAGEASDTTRLVVLSAADGSELRMVHHDVRCDIDDVLFGEDDNQVEAVLVDFQRQEWVVKHERVKEDFAVLGALCKGNWDIVSRDREDATWIVNDLVDNGSPRFFLYSRATKTATLLFLARPELEKFTLVPMQSHVIEASDGEKLVVFVTLPAGVPPAGLPTVLLVHGGPWARDHWGWNPQAQWLANRGYACVQVNFRASTGYGKRWLHLGDVQWGRTMQQDLSDAAAWAAREGFADPARTAIMGGSYGGYATLAGLAFTPEVFCCGVDIVGPAHLRTLLESVPAYWAPMKKMLALRVGDVEESPGPRHGAARAQAALEAAAAARALTWGG